MGVRIGKRVFDDGCAVVDKTSGRDRRRLRAQRRQRRPVALPGGRRLQVRPDRDRRRLHGRDPRPRPLRHDDGRRIRPRPALVPDQGRGGSGSADWAGNPAALSTTDERSHDAHVRGGEPVPAAEPSESDTPSEAPAVDATAIPRWTLDPKPGVGELRVTAFGDLGSRSAGRGEARPAGRVAAAGSARQGAGGALRRA